MPAAFSWTTMQSVKRWRDAQPWQVGVAIGLVFAVVATTGPAVAQTSTDDEARGLFLAGRAAFNAARYDDALDYFRRSYQLSERPDLLYNIGQTADRVRHDAEALEAFEAYLAAVPDAPNRVEVEGRVRYLHAALDHASEPTTPPEPPTEIVTAGALDAPEESASSAPAVAVAAAPVASSVDPVPWIVAGTGGAALIAGVVLLAVGGGDVAALGAPRPEETYPEASARQIQGGTVLGIGVGLAAIGAALGVAGLVWGMGGHEGEGGVALRVGPGGITLDGRF